MIVDFSKINMREMPVLLLKNIEGTILGVIHCKNDSSFVLNYNSISTLEFTVPAYINENKNETYSDINGMMIVTVMGVGDFILNDPQEINDGIKKEKQCKAYSLEYEFTYKKLSLPEGTYNFYDPLDLSMEDPSDCKSVLGIIIRRYYPHWTIGDVDEQLIGKYRTFSVSGQNIYDFLMNTVQKSFNCLFSFDTTQRKISIRNADIVDDSPSHTPVRIAPVYISMNNLAKKITIDEDTDNIFTCLDVNGADGVSIRDVNPLGTNKIYNFEYLMSSGKISSDFKEKYNQWKSKVDEQRQNYFNLSIEYSIIVEKRVSEDANLKALQGELDAIQAQIDVYNEYVSQESSTPEIDINTLKSQKANKETEIYNKVSEIENIEIEKQAIYSEISAIVDDCKIENNFSNDDYILFNKLVKEDSISESSFVYRNTDSYTDATNSALLNKNIIIDNSQGSLTIKISDDHIKNIYRFSGGHIEIGDVLSSDINNAAVEYRLSSDNTISVVLTAYLGAGNINEKQFESACLTISGTASEFENDFFYDDTTTEGTSLTITNVSGSIYLTTKLSDFAKKSVSWDLFDYGESILKKISQPSYTFSVDSTNFFSIEDFKSFVNSINLGDAIYLEIDEDRVLTPIFIGAGIKYDSLESLTLSFSDSFVGSDGTFKLIDLLEKSVSMGKTVDAGKYTYSAFIDSGAKTAVDTFMSSTLDVAKNAIINSQGQGMTWDKTGLRLRKYKDSTMSSFEDEQIWMSNNSIMFTDDNWNTAKMAIGKFKDSYGIAAPYLVGTVIIGENLTIEAKSPTSETMLFKVDGNGVQINNGDLSITSGVSTIALNPEFGFAIGDNGLYTLSTDGTKQLNTERASFYIDTDGNLNIKGHVRATSFEAVGCTIPKDSVEGLNEELDKLDSLEYQMGDIIDDLKQIDGFIQTFYQDTDPSLNWDKSEHSEHEGDIWVNIGSSDIDTYQWEVVDIENETPIYDWIPISSDYLTNLAKSKAKIFTGSVVPTPPYNIGDLWVQGAGGDILHCIRSRNKNEGYNVNDWTKSSKYTDDSALNTFKESYEETLSSINGQLDQKAETWCQATDPSSQWTDDTTKKLHIGDLWFNTDTNKSYIYGASYTWEEPVSEIPQSVYDKIDGKRQVFIKQPTSNDTYNTGDLWVLEIDTCVYGVQYKSGTILVAVTPEGERFGYIESDWFPVTTYDGLLALDNSAQAVTALNNIGDDSVITPTEKQQIKFMMQNITSEYNSIIKQCNEYNSADKTVIDTSSFATAYNNLKSLTDDILVDLTTTISVPDGYPSRFTVYYNEKESVITDIEVATKGLYNDLEEQLGQIYDDLGQIDGFIQTFYQDDPPSIDWEDSEYPEHEGDIWVDTDSSDIDTYQWEVVGNGYDWVKIASDFLTNLAKSKARIFTKKPTEYSKGDLIIPSEEFTVGDLTYSAGKVYTAINSSSVFDNSHWTGLDYTNDDSLNSFIAGDYKNDLDLIKGQLDQKAETWYQVDDPSSQWIDDTTKGLHVGDLWFNPNTSKNYIYSSSYTWVESVANIPQSVYDKIDGKSSIYTNRPENQHVGDLLIPSGTFGFTYNSITYTFYSNKIYRCFQSNDAFRPDLWTEVSYTDDTKANQAYSLANSAATMGEKLANGLGFKETEITGRYVISPVIAGGTLLIGDANGVYAQIDEDGKLSCNGADITGVVKADIGRIGAFEIKSVEDAFGETKNVIAKGNKNSAESFWLCPEGYGSNISISSPILNLSLKSNTYMSIGNWYSIGNFETASTVGSKFMMLHGSILAENIYSSETIHAGSITVSDSAQAEILSVNVANIGNGDVCGGIEIYGGDVSGIAKTPYIDFHYENSGDDYTSRIYESESGTLSVSGNFLIRKDLTVTNNFTVNRNLKVLDSSYNVGIGAMNSSNTVGFYSTDTGVANGYIQFWKDSTAPSTDPSRYFDISFSRSTNKTNYGLRLLSTARIDVRATSQLSLVSSDDDVELRSGAQMRLYAGSSGILACGTNSAGIWGYKGNEIQTQTGSDISLKNSVTAFDDIDSIFFDNLRPVRFKYNSQSDDSLHMGFIAQETVDALKKSGRREDYLSSVYKQSIIEDGEFTDKKYYHIDYREFVALNTNEIQKLKKRIIELENTIKTLKGE